MSHNLFIVDDWLPDPVAFRQEALRLPFYDIKLNGDTFKRIHPRSTDENKVLLERTLNAPIEQTYSFFRLNYDGELPKDVVHHDSELGGYVGLVYLTQREHCQGGTGLWRHQETGRTAWPTEHSIRLTGKSPKRELAKFDDSWKDITKWELVDHAEMRFNRLVVFPAECFHSRWPHNPFGSTPEDGRLIWITFFHRAEDKCAK